MNSLDQLKLQRELKGDVKRSPEYNWTQADLADAWRDITPAIRGITEVLANSTNSLEEIVAIQQAVPGLGDLATMPPGSVLKFCNQLRTVWTELEASVSKKNKLVRGEARAILEEWWTEYPLDPNGPHWNVYFQTGTFFPSPKNYRALIARVCFDSREHLGLCMNPQCKKYFIKPRKTSKFCSSCYAYDNRQRQRKSRENREIRKRSAHVKGRK